MVTNNIIITEGTSTSTNPESLIADDLEATPQNVTSGDIIVDSLIAEDLEAPASEGNGSGLKKRDTRLSVISRKYDVGEKGYLDEEERIIRNYDTNNDGNIDMNELKKIVKDLREEKGQKIILKKVACAFAASLVLVFLCNFALVYAT